ncbi:DUF58 domain-containing protein [Herbiconiux daphne]|uniref:DUF58 domain-containing protein n=1 Tax=Herbiconiux daphne TaxID=2970914 RepID=A0ABT2H1T9_9MICO|nr:DUF58 domain-containing protein [Herbiconiux daphne]MCS5733884.1 DUF58 domain-containing protein [Herbiconiux daphne]
MTAPRPERTAPRLTVRGWGFVVAAIVAFVATQVFRRQELAYLACFLIAVPVFSLAWVALRRLALKVRRRFSPEAGSVNQTVMATIFLQNWGSLRTPAAVWVERAGEPLRPSDPAPLPALPGYSSSTLDEPAAQRLRYRLDTRYRGAHQIGPFQVTVTDPFGCAIRRVRFGGTDTVLVTPTVYELARIDLRLSAGDGAEQVSRRLVGAGEQDVIARKYQPGDSIRRVHWPATAKHGQLMVRQDDQRNDQDAVIVIDAHSFARDDGSRRGAGRAGRAGRTGRAGRPGGAGRPGSTGGFSDPDGRRGSEAEVDPAFEWAVSAVGSFAVHLMNEGYGVRLVGHAPPHFSDDDDAVFAAPHGLSRVVRDLAFASRDALHDPVEFRQAVEEAALTSPDAPPVFAIVSNVPGSAARIRDLAAMSSHPIAFVVGADSAARRASVAVADRSVATELRGAGWSVLECTAHDDLPSLWKALGDARGIA